MADSKVRIGLLGAGAMGAEHAFVYSQIESVEVAGVFSRDPERAKTVAASCGAEAFTNAAALIGLDGLVRIDPTGIKPDNLLVRDGRPVLIDFGWAVAPDLPQVTPAGLGDEGRAPEGFCDVHARGVALT